MNDIIQTLLRSVLKIGAGYCIAKGIVSDSEAETVIASLLAMFGVLWGVVHRTPLTPSPPSQSKVSVLFLFGTLSAAVFFGTACHTPQLAPGGAYAPVTVSTNATGEIITTALTAPETALFVTDASYKLSYDLVAGVFKFERDNRAALQEKFPQLKTNLDRIRPVAWQVHQRWGIARAAYKANPTPAGLTHLQSIIAEIGRLVPVVQAELAATIK